MVTFLAKKNVMNVRAHVRVFSSHVKKETEKKGFCGGHLIIGTNKNLSKQIAIISDTLE